MIASSVTPDTGPMLLGHGDEAECSSSPLLADMFDMEAIQEGLRRLPEPDQATHFVTVEAG